MESPTILGLLSWVFIKGPQKKNLHSGILQLKLFNLFQAFNSWGSSKRCEQKKNRRGLLLISTILGLLSWVFIKGPQKKNLHSGILQLKLFNLFQAFNSWGSSKRCEQKKNRRGLLLIFFLVLCLRATLHYQNAWKRLETIS